MTMRESETMREELERIREQRDALQAELHERIAQIESLNRELADTNSGVVALYAELDDKAAELRDVSELKSRFLSYMSHEFRTPLGSIRSISRILLDRMDGPLTDEQEKQVRFIQGSAEELTDMVNDLLDLAKIDAGRISISPQWFEMVDLFAALRGMFKPVLTNRAVILVFEEPIDVPRVYTDDKKLSQILRNFISNALKFTQKGEGTRLRAVPRARMGDLRGSRHRHRNRQGASARAFPGFCATRLAHPEEISRHRSGTRAQQTPRGTAGRERRGR